MQEFARIQAAHKADLEAITAERTKLQTELATAASKAAAVDKEKASMENRLDQLGLTIKQLEDKVHQRDNEVQRLQGDLGAKADEADAHAAEAAKLAEELHETKDALDQKIKALAGISMFAAQTNIAPPSSVPLSSAKRRAAASPQADPHRTKHRVRFNDVPVIRTLDLDEDLPPSQGHDAYVEEAEDDGLHHDGSEPQDIDDWEADAGQDSMAMVVHGAPRAVRQTRQRRSQPLVEEATDSEEEEEAAFTASPRALQRNKQRPVLPPKRSSKQVHARNRQVLAAMRPGTSHNAALGKAAAGGIKKGQGVKGQRGHQLFSLFGGLAKASPGDT